MSSVWVNVAQNCDWPPLGRSDDACCMHFLCTLSGVMGGGGGEVRENKFFPQLREVCVLDGGGRGDMEEGELFHGKERLKAVHYKQPKIPSIPLFLTARPLTQHPTVSDASSSYRKWKSALDAGSPSCSCMQTTLLFTLR